MRLLLFLLMPLFCSAQLYTIYDCTTKSELYATMEVPLDPAVCFTYVKRTGYWCCPKFNTTTNTWYNDATPQQQEAWEAAQVAANTNPEADSAINNVLSVAQTNAQLNVLYSLQGGTFTLYCPKIQWGSFVGTGTAYIKQSDGTWLRQPIYLNQ